MARHVRVITRGDVSTCGDDIDTDSDDISIRGDNVCAHRDNRSTHGEDVSSHVGKNDAISLNSKEKRAIFSTKILLDLVLDRWLNANQR